jgi:hypothetical protein
MGEIDCGADCTRSLSSIGRPLTLTASPVQNSTFAGWGGACSGTGATCTVTLAKATAVIAYFRSSFKMLAAGQFHTCSLRPAGDVVCWGQNDEGQLGRGVFSGPMTPAPVKGIATAVAIAAGGYHTCALMVGGSVQCWGRNMEGQDGIATFGASSATPTAVTGITTAVAVTAGGYHSCVVNAGGTASCWGLNGGFQLGAITPFDHSSVPVAVSLVTVGPLSTKIAAGGYHTCAIVAADSTVACWGNNDFGQLGRGALSGGELPGARVQVPDPGCSGTPPAGCAGTTTFLVATSIAASIGVGQGYGGYHTVAIDGSGQDWAWGANLAGQSFPITSTAEPYADKDPIFLPNPNFLKAAAGSFNKCMIRGAGLGVFCLGSNNNGESGTPGVAVPDTIPAVDVVVGGFHSCAVTPILFGDPTPPGGAVVCWGENAAGQVTGVPGANVTIPRTLIYPNTPLTP